MRGSVDTTAGQSPAPQRLNMVDLDEKRNDNDERFQSTYLRGDHQPTLSFDER